MILANVIWPFHGAFLAQLIPLFIFIEWLILARYFRGARRSKVFGITILANLGSAVAGCILVTPFGFNWDSGAQKASEEFASCIVALLVTIPIEYGIVGFFHDFGDRKRLWHAVFYMNFYTYCICFAVVAYHWRWGVYAE